MSKYDVVLKKTETVKVASIRAVAPTPADQGALWAELIGRLNEQKARMIGPPMAIYHDGEFRERDWDIEVCMPIAEEITADQRLNVYSLPGFETVACVVHAGPFARIGKAYDAMAKWMDENGYQSVGPWRELNLRPPEPPGNQNDPNTLTEIQFPVAKA
jgi:effector-binding domain-containing protein